MFRELVQLQPWPSLPLLRGTTIAGKAIEGDRFHERYRQQLVAEFPQVKELVHQHEAYATYLSGAGPTIMTLLPVEHAVAFAKDT